MKFLNLSVFIYLVSMSSFGAVTVVPVPNTMTGNARLDDRFYYDHVPETEAPATQAIVDLALFYGDYNVTFRGQVGGEYQPTNSIVSGTTTGLSSFSTAGTISLSASEPGVISVPAGEAIPGVAPEDIIFGAAVMQNPIRVVMGATQASPVGNFSIFSLLKFGLPSGPTLLDRGCSGGRGPFSCVPVFFRRTTLSGDSVNLVYFTIQASGNNSMIRINGRLMDTHKAEAAAANLFSVPIKSPILGAFIDQFMFDKSATFEMIVSGNSISGWFQETGISAAGLAPQTAIYKITFDGVKHRN